MEHWGVGGRKILETQGEIWGLQQTPRAADAGFGNKDRKQGVISRGISSKWCVEVLGPLN